MGWAGETDHRLDNKVAGQMVAPVGDKCKARKREKPRGLRTGPWGSPMPRVKGDEKEPAKETGPGTARGMTRRAQHARIHEEKEISSHVRGCIHNLTEYWEPAVGSPLRKEAHG